MSRRDADIWRASDHGSVVFPPGLAGRLCALAAQHRGHVPLTEPHVEEVLTSTFFASLRTEEREHHPLRIAITAHSRTNEAAGADGWHVARFRAPVACGTRQLVRLARVVRSDRLFIAVAASDRLEIVGIAHEDSDPNSRALKLLALNPGSLELWIGTRRVLDYSQGRVMEAPENVLLAAGSVRDRLHELCAGADMFSYVQSVTALIRQVDEHGYGGILILADQSFSAPDPHAGFMLESGLSVGAVLERLARARNLDEATRALVEPSLRAELERTLFEVGWLTALDGATMLDTALNVIGFGVVLPVVDDVTVLEALDAAATRTAPFPVHQYGARHRAAASFAAMNPGSLVFMASTDGDMACMLREVPATHVIMWRFRSSDLSNE